MKSSPFDKTDSGIYGKAFEMAVKDALRRKNADKVSPCGSADFRYNSHNYDTKQNGSVVKYNPSSRYIKGSSRVLYATHVAYTITAETETTISLAIDLASTDMFVLDRNDFIKFLLSVNGVKVNASRGTANIQTSYNYKKDAYHGRLGHKIEAWAYENENDDDDIIGTILESLD